VKPKEGLNRHLPAARITEKKKGKGNPFAVGRKKRNGNSFHAATLEKRKLVKPPGLKKKHSYVVSGKGKQEKNRGRHDRPKNQDAGRKTCMKEKGSIMNEF